MPQDFNNTSTQTSSLQFFAHKSVIFSFLVCFGFVFWFFPYRCTKKEKLITNVYSRKYNKEYSLKTKLLKGNVNFQPSVKTVFFSKSLISGIVSQDFFFTTQLDNSMILTCLSHEDAQFQFLLRNNHLIYDSIISNQYHRIP